MWMYTDFLNSLSEKYCTDKSMYDEVSISNVSEHVTCFMTQITQNLAMSLLLGLS